MNRETFKFLLILAAILIIGIAGSQAEEGNCAEYDRHTCAKERMLVPTKEPLVCVRVAVKGTQKVTYHFRRPDRTYYRTEDPVARTITGTQSKFFGRHRFEKILRDGGSLKICAGERGEYGVVFEREDIIRHLDHGPICKETIQLTGGVYPKKKGTPESKLEVPESQFLEAPRTESPKVKILNPSKP